MIRLVNDAFEEDAFFKLPHRRQRIKWSPDDAGGVESMDDLLPHSLFLVCEREGELVGAVRVESKVENGVGTFGMLAVPKAFAKQGVGKRLVHHAENELRDRFGCTRCEIAVVNLRKSVAAFYERAGYKHTGKWIEFEQLVGEPTLAPDYKGVCGFDWMAKDL